MQEDPSREESNFEYCPGMLLTYVGLYVCCKWKSMTPALLTNINVSMSSKKKCIPPK